MDSGPIIIGISIIIVSILIFVTLSVKKEAEVKEKEKEKAKEMEKTKTKTIDVTVDETNAPYATQPIMNVDDYEYSMVFQNEGDRAITKAQRDLLMSKYPMDWTVQPPSSSKFQQGLAEYRESFANPPPPQAGNPFKEIDGSSLTPPDTLSAEKKEREILATYVPKKPQELTTYSAEDAQELIKRVYESKGLVADYKEVKPGVFVIVGTRGKNEKVVYEDEVGAAATYGPNQAVGERATGDLPRIQVSAPSGESTIEVPPVSVEVNGGLDPFFTPSEKVRDGKWDYTRWTPGLERAFAPTESMTHWF